VEFFALQLQLFVGRYETSKASSDAESVHRSHFSQSPLHHSAGVPLAVALPSTHYTFNSSDPKTVFVHSREGLLLTNHLPSGTSRAVAAIRVFDSRLPDNTPWKGAQETVEVTTPSLLRMAVIKRFVSAVCTPLNSQLLRDKLHGLFFPLDRCPEIPVFFIFIFFFFFFFFFFLFFSLCYIFVFTEYVSSRPARPSSPQAELMTMRSSPWSLSTHVQYVLRVCLKPSILLLSPCLLNPAFLPSG
jgi:hypothetical protein